MSCFEETLLRVLKIEETGGGKHPKRQTRDVPAIYLCRRGPPARNLRHFLFFSPLSSFSSTFLSLFLSPAPFILSLSAPLRIFFFLFVLVFLPHLSSPFFSLSLPSHAVSRSLSLSQCRFVPFCGFTSRPDFTNGHTVPFWGNMSHVVPSFPSRKESCFGVVRLTAPPALQGNEIIESDTLIPWKGCWDIFVGSK